jgi:hypothetical protein
MKKLFITIYALIIALSLQAQIFGTSGTLKKGTFSIGLEPAVLVNSGYNDFMFFAHGGYGLKQGIDLGIHCGFGDRIILLLI